MKARASRFSPTVILLALLVGHGAPAADHFLVPRRHLLIPCAEYLATDESPVRRGLLRRFSMYTIADEPTFGFHVVRIDEPRGEPLTLSLPDLVHTEATWRRERWTVAGGAEDEPPYWFYEVGFRNLEDDGRRMNGAVAAPLLSSNAVHLRFTSSDQRVRDLERLNTFRWACHDRVMNRYREHKGKQKYLGDLDFEQFLAADRRNLNVDVFGVTARQLDWDAGRREIRDALISTIQVSYDEPRDFLRPTLDGLLEVQGEPGTEARRLPFMDRLAPERRDEFMAKFWQRYGHMRICEVTRYVNTRTPAVIVNRLLFEMYRHVRLRKCQLMVASGDPHSLRLFRAYGFERDEALPTQGSANEALAILRVNSPTFFEVFDRLRQRALVEGSAYAE